MPSVTTFLAEVLATPSTVYVASRPSRCLATSSLHSAPGAVEVAVIVEDAPVSLEVSTICSPTFDAKTVEAESLLIRSTTLWVVAPAATA